MIRAVISFLKPQIFIEINSFIDCLLHFFPILLLLLYFLLFLE